MYIKVRRTHAALNHGTHNRLFEMTFTILLDIAVISWTAMMVLYWDLNTGLIVIPITHVSYYDV